MTNQERNKSPVDVRQWTAAERQAQKAEEVLKAAHKAHIERGEPAPTLDMQRSAAELRAHADAIFRRLAKQLPDTGVP